MDFELTIKIITVSLVIFFFIIRSRFTKHQKFSKSMLIKYFVAVPLLIIYMTSLIDFAIIKTSPFIRILVGLPIIFFGFSLFILAHYNLGKNWSTIVEGRLPKSKKLVKTGPYKYMRHPIYSAAFITIIGFGIFTANWILFLVPLVLFLILYIIRMPKEEKALVNHFGKEYSDYMKQTGRVFPKII